MDQNFLPTFWPIFFAFSHLDFDNDEAVFLRTCFCESKRGTKGRWVLRSKESRNSRRSASRSGEARWEKEERISRKRKLKKHAEETRERTDETKGGRRSRSRTIEINSNGLHNRNASADTANCPGRAMLWQCCTNKARYAFWMQHGRSRRRTSSILRTAEIRARQGDLKLLFSQCVMFSRSISVCVCVCVLK